jgi:hypothetical protein
MILLIFLRLGKLAILESLCEACADGDICTPLHLHTLISAHQDIPSRERNTYLKNIIPAIAKILDIISLAKILYY